MKVVVAGGSGFLGRRLTAALAREGHDVILLSRRASAPSDGVAAVRVWDGATSGSWAADVAAADAVVNLSGESIAAARWTPERKDLLRKSRIESTTAIARAMAARNAPGVLVNASAVGYYGDVPSGDVIETAPRGAGFLADLSAEWESAAMQAAAGGTRVVLPRIGIVLDRTGGALEKMIPFFRFFVGGPLGSGRQWFPWIHLDDVVGAILFSLRTPAIAGPVNLAAPEPATMQEFAAALGRALGRPSMVPAPPFALRLLLGEMAGMLLAGQRAIPQVLMRNGYTFRYPRLQEALAAALRA